MSSGIEKEEGNSKYEQQNLVIGKIATKFEKMKVGGGAGSERNSVKQYQDINNSVTTRGMKPSSNSLLENFNGQKSFNNSSEEQNEESTYGTMKHRMNICQWIAFGVLVLIFLFLFGFLIYEWSTWKEERINRYG